MSIIKRLIKKAVNKKSRQGAKTETGLQLVDAFRKQKKKAPIPPNGPLRI